MTHAFVLGALVLALAASACGRSAPPAPKQVVVTIHAMQFDPAEVHVRPGDTIVWQNDDLVAHTETAAGGAFNGITDGGKSWSVAAPAPGSYPYACTLHPTMKGVVVVER